MAPLGWKMPPMVLSPSPKCASGILNLSANQLLLSDLLAVCSTIAPALIRIWRHSYGIVGRPRCQLPARRLDANNRLGRRTGPPGGRQECLCGRRAHASGTVPPETWDRL